MQVCEVAPVPPIYPVADTVYLAQREKDDVITLDKLKTEFFNRKLRCAFIKKSGVLFEHVVYRAADRNARIKKYQDVVHPDTGAVLTSYICGFDKRCMEEIPIVNITDADYFSCDGVCTGPKKCPKHDRWDAMKLSEIEAILFVAIRDLEHTQNLIHTCIKRIKDRREWVLECKKDAVTKLQKFEVPRSFEGYYEVGI